MTVAASGKAVATQDGLLESGQRFRAIASANQLLRILGSNSEAVAQERQSLSSNFDPSQGPSLASPSAMVQLDQLLGRNQQLSRLNLALDRKHEELVARAKKYVGDHGRPSPAFDGA